MRKHLFPSTLLVLLFASLALGTSQFTLEQVLNSPFPSELVASPQGNRIAWVFNEMGVRNIWLAGPPGYHPQQLTDFLQDDGQEIADLSWSPDGDQIVFVRGGSPNRQGENPNPALLPGGTSQQIWIADLETSSVKIVTAGGNPFFSPDGQQILYLNKGKIWMAPIMTATESKPLFVGRGRFSELTLSPGGERLAFVSDRGSHSLVGVFNLKTGQLSYLGPSVDRDDSPVWSPSGEEIAFIRRPARTRSSVFGARRSGQPWSIWVADPATAEARQLWLSDRGPGSVFRRMVASSQLLWLASDQIVFPWEKDGWTHLYAVTRSGGEAKLLTPGAFEVEHVAMSADRTRILFSSNQNDVDRRHVWKLGGSMNSPVALTSGQGIEWSPVPIGDTDNIALLRSDARLPARPAVLIGASTPKDIASDQIPAEFPASSLVEPIAVRFPAADGMTVYGQLFLPSDLKNGGRRPAVIFFHGGSRRQMLVGWHYMDYYHNAYALNQYLVNLGYIVLSVNYRSGIGYGLNFREALSYGATGGSEFNDVQGAGLYLRSRPDVDPGRIGLWGGSYGGYLTAMGLARSSDLFAAGVDLHGVHDWNLEWRRMTDGWDEGREAEVRRVAWESSPMAYLDTWRSPVLMIHGDDDRNVAFTQTVQLAEDLRNRGVAVELLIFPDEVHGFLLYRHWLEAYQRTAEFFDKHLRR